MSEPIPLPKRNSDGSYTTPPAGMAIDGDGANGFTDGIPVYAPKGWGKTLDYLANAGSPGNWYGIVCDPDGHPYKQQKGDPAPGAYISATSYEHKAYPRWNPRRYVDSASVPYIVLPSHWRKQAKGIVLGCKAQIVDAKTGKTLDCVVGDFGPRAKLGEASIAAAKFFNVPWSPKDGGATDRRFIYTFWPGVAANGFELQPM